MLTVTALETARRRGIIRADDGHIGKVYVNGKHRPEVFEVCLFGGWLKEYRKVNSVHVIEDDALVVDTVTFQKGEAIYIAERDFFGNLAPRHLSLRTGGQPIDLPLRRGR